jgi:ribose 5-phosphate isomerase A
VDHLGRFPLPIEVVQYGWQATRRSVSALLTDLGYDVEIVRRARDGEPVVTDSGNFILDARMGVITDKATLDTNLNWIAGVVEHGLFTGIAHEVLMASPSGESRLIELPHRNAARIPEWRK